MRRGKKERNKMDGTMMTLSRHVLQKSKQSLAGVASSFHISLQSEKYCISYDIQYLGAVLCVYMCVYQINLMFINGNWV